MKNIITLENVKEKVSDFFKRAEAGEMKPAQEDVSYTEEEIQAMKDEKANKARAEIEDYRAKRAAVLAKIAKAVGLSDDELALLA